MQALLSYDQSPPFSAPLRFFLTAPLFGLLAGALVLWQGPGLFASRWTPAALALTHLITVGFMLHIMLGALLQLLPVVAGAHLARPGAVATGVHAGLTLGALALVAAFLSGHPVLYGSATLLLGSSVGVFVAAAAWALRGVGPGQATVVGMKLALFGLGVTVSLGAVLALSLGQWIAWPALAATSLHVGWGLLGWTVSDVFQWPTLAALLQALSVVAGAVLAGATLATTLRSKRARRDPTQATWQLAMVCLLLAAGLWLAAVNTPVGALWVGWPLLWGVLVLWGGLVSVMVGMLYKIVPFLVWLHLRRLGQGKVHAPHMKLILPERAQWLQVALHGLTLLLLMAATVWPTGFTYAAGTALLASNAALLRNVLLALKAYRQHMGVIATSPPRPKHH